MCSIYFIPHKGLIFRCLLNKYTFEKFFGFILLKKCLNTGAADIKKVANNDAKPYRVKALA